MVTDAETDSTQRPWRRVTLHDVARDAEVSVTSASRSLHGVSKGARAPSQATVDRVRATAARLGYSRDNMASGLRTKQSRLLGVLVPRLSDYVLATIYEGIEDAAGLAGYRTVVANSRDNLDEQRARTEVMLDHRVDGLIFGDAHADGAFVDELRDRGLPFVLVNRRAGDHPAVTCDDVAGGRLAARHLLALGHTRMAVLAGEPFASTGRERSQGFVGECRRQGVQVHSDSVVNCPFDTHGGRSAMQQILDTSRGHPTGVFAVNDFAAIGAMGAIRDRGLRVGHDVAVVGFNDVALAAELPLPLTTVSSHMEEMGRGAVQVLLELLGGAPPRSIRLEPELVVRASTDTEQLKRLERLLRP